MKRAYPTPIKCIQRNTFTFLKVSKSLLDLMIELKVNEETMQQNHANLE